MHKLGPHPVDQLRDKKIQLHCPAVAQGESCPMLDLARKSSDAMGAGLSKLHARLKIPRLHRGQLAKRHMHFPDTCDVHICSSFGKRQWIASHTKSANGTKKVCEGKGTRKEKERTETRYARMDGWCLGWRSLRLEEGIPDRQALP